MRSGLPTPAAIQFVEISLQGNAGIVGTKQLPDVITTVNKLIEEEMSDSDYNDPRYSYRVYVAPRPVNNRSKADQAVVFAPAGSDIEMAIREGRATKVYGLLAELSGCGSLRLSGQASA